MSLKLIEHQTIPSISGPATPHTHPSLHHHPMHSSGHHFHQHPTTYGHPHHYHHNHPLSLLPSPHLRSEPQQTIPLSLSMNSHQQHTPSHPTDQQQSHSTGHATATTSSPTEEVTSLSWPDKKKGTPAVTSLSSASSSSSLSPQNNRPTSRATPTSTNQKMEVDYEEPIHSNKAATTTTTTMASPPTSSSLRSSIGHLRTYHSHSGEPASSENEDESMGEDKNNNIRPVKGGGSDSEQQPDAGERKR